MSAERQRSALKEPEVAFRDSQALHRVDNENENVPPLAGLREYGELVTRNLRAASLAALAAMVVTAIITMFAMMHWYHAFAIIEPQQEDTAYAKLFGMPGRQASAAFQLAGSMIPGAQSASAQEFLTILGSYGFTHEVIQHLGLQSKLLRDRSLFVRIWISSRDPQWTAYKAFQSRFSATYSFETNSISLSFLDPDRAEAVRILQTCIDRLRAYMQARQLKETSAAFEAIKSKLTSLSDPLLKNKLYELLAAQIESESISQAEADYSFHILEPPVSEPFVYSPRVVFDIACAGILAFIGTILIAGLREALQSPRNPA